MTNGRRRVAEPQVDVYPLQALGVRLAAAADHDDMGALLEQGAVGHLDRGIGESRQDVGALVDVFGAVAHLHLDVVFRRHLAAEALSRFSRVGLNT